MKRNTVHLSIDDVGKSLRWISNERPASIFGARFFGTLRRWHEQYNAMFTLYAYLEIESFSITDFPLQYVDDFRKNAHWLKLGYHGNSTISFIEETDYEKGFVQFNNAASRLNAGKTDTLRLHYWKATPQQKDFLSRSGVSCLLYPDDSGLPYGENDTFYDCGLLHRRTRVRFENIDEITPHSLAIGREHVDAFTHEWCFDEVASKMENAMEIYSKHGYGFIV